MREMPRPSDWTKKARRTGKRLATQAGEKLQQLGDDGTSEEVTEGALRAVDEAPDPPADTVADVAAEVEPEIEPEPEVDVAAADDQAVAAEPEPEPTVEEADDDDTVTLEEAAAAALAEETAMADEAPAEAFVAAELADIDADDDEHDDEVAAIDLTTAGTAAAATAGAFVAIDADTDDVAPAAAAAVAAAAAITNPAPAPERPTPTTARQPENKRRRRGAFLVAGGVAVAVLAGAVYLTLDDDSTTSGTEATAVAPANDDAAASAAQDDPAEADDATVTAAEADAETDAPPEPQELTSPGTPGDAGATADDADTADETEKGSEPAETGVSQEIEPIALAPSGFLPALPGPDDADADTSADAEAEADATDGAAGADDVPESKAVVRGGKIYLSGAVPTQQDADDIAALAAEVLGEDNVINEYVVDPRAGDPSLGNVQVDDPVLFNTNSAEIAPEFEPLLGQALALLSLRPEVTMTIFGHTDDIGSEADNQALSQARAEAVVAWLVERGVDPDRLEAIGKGESDPIDTNDTDAGRQANRRIQVIIENLLS